VHGDIAVTQPAEYHLLQCHRNRKHTSGVIKGDIADTVKSMKQSSCCLALASQVMRVRGGQAFSTALGDFQRMTSPSGGMGRLWRVHPGIAAWVKVGGCQTLSGCMSQLTFSKQQPLAATQNRKSAG
jgi:hypothetical protein